MQIPLRARGEYSMQVLWSRVRPQLVYIAAFSFFINLLFLVPAIFTLQVFDRVISSNSQETLLVLLLGTAIALLFLLLLDYVRNRLQNLLGNMIDERLGPPVVKTIVARTARAPHAARMESIRDIALLRNAFAANALVSVFDAPWIPIYVLVIWAFHPALGAGAALAAGFMLLLAWLNNRTTSSSLDTLQKEGRRASQFVEGSLRNAEVLQALGMTDRLLERWRRLQDRVSTLQTRASRGGVAFTALTKTTRQAIQVLMLSLGAYLVLLQEASAGIMIATTILLGRAIQPVEQLVASWRSLADARGAYRRLSELSAHFEPAEQRVSLPRPQGRLVVESVSYRAPGSDRLIVFNVAFSLAPGEALAVIGPSAAGKSTLARLLTGVWTPTSGVVRLDGANIADWPREEIGPWIGYVPQDVELFDGTIAENIARLDKVYSDAVVSAARRANAHDMILTLPRGYDTPIGEQGLRLSPGQRQRIALARALYGNPQLIVLDEPNSNLDGAGESALAHALSGLCAAGATSVVITHRPALIAHVDKILVLESGRVQMFGPAAEVMKAMQRQAQAAVDGRAA
jgi:ATP-binding cassette subfamily C exporter for protease/lipase/ATP-binding cassette subfamily C protein EexD